MDMMSTDFDVFDARWKMWLPSSVNKMFFLHSTTQKRKVFEHDFSHENIPTPERSQAKSQIPHANALNIV